MSEDEEQLEAMLLEVQRMFPPFLGGRRVAREVVNITKSISQSINQLINQSVWNEGGE